MNVAFNNNSVSAIFHDTSVINVIKTSIVNTSIVVFGSTHQDQQSQTAEACSAASSALQQVLV